MCRQRGRAYICFHSSSPVGSQLEKAREHSSVFDVAETEIESSVVVELQLVSQLRCYEHCDRLRPTCRDTIT
ncbi:hypothetical protein F2P81_006708 [Scophthalmus maximus]|uniref:Uncharacterized protein n=1 Tax=Scophthalmus maximus TaxID=52904 RepID=A0A6A4TAB9_SCOMX|nr:hypothetical protein F2P81_006708 [Scophthalmus maximus]